MPDVPPPANDNTPYRRRMTQERVRELLDYNQDTGVFVWRQRLDSMGRRNGKFFGKVAGGYDKDGYIVIGIDGKTWFAHRLAVLHATGLEPNEVDHENHIRDDNRLSNLRCADHTSNMRNQSLSSANTSGQTGVYWHKPLQKWRARIKMNGKSISLGLYNDLNDAIAARLVAERKFGFHENHGMVA